MKSEQENLMTEKLDEIKALLKILAFRELQQMKHSVISTKNKERIYELCTGDNEMGEIAKQVKVSNESVRLSIRDFENAGLVITSRNGKKLFPRRVL